VRKREIASDNHVGVTGADFPKLEKLVWDSREDTYVLKCTKKTRERIARFFFDKPDLEVEIGDYVWSDSDERDRYIEEEKMTRIGMTSSSDDEMASSDDDEMASSDEDKMASSDDDEMASPDDHKMANADDDDDMASFDADDDMASFGDDEMTSSDDDEDLP
jgi:hypothetical protein